MSLESLFSKEKIGDIQIKNRIVRSATFENMTPEGHVNDRYVNLYSELAKGGTGLIITGALSTNFIYSNPEFMDEMKRIADVVHQTPDAKIAVQINNSGMKISPSEVPGRKTVNSDEIKDIIDRFAFASKRVYEVGFDMVQIHSSHGYFLSRMISPYFNKRTDDYGGSTENRCSILLEIVDQIKDQTSKKFPVMIKLQSEDFIPDGLTADETKEIVRILDRNKGYSAIEPSGGGSIIPPGQKTYPSVIIKSKAEENFFLPIAEGFKPLMKNSKLILMGGLRDPMQIDAFIRENQADFVSFCRPLIREPNLPNRWKDGDLGPAKCVSCNQCFQTMYSPERLHCAVEKRLNEK
jgi:2,4-dienoyl-CoA reductase-like NADH-dependent reductase (Old Yellow Enzyme family)